MIQEYNKKRGQLNQEERIEIYALRKQGISLRGIGKILKRAHTTISKELDRNSIYLGWDRYRYNPLEANKKAKERRVKTNQKNTKLLKNPKMLKLFEERFIVEADSQGIDEIIGRMRKEGIAMVCASTMYSFIRRYKPERERLLRYKNFGYKKRKGKAKKTALVGVSRLSLISVILSYLLPNTQTLHDYGFPLIFLLLMVLTPVERQTRFVIIKKLKRATKKEVMLGIVEALRNYEVMSITSDNGSEFAGLKEVGEILDCLVYRCHPYSSWEKGGNERMNGLIRWFIPKRGSIQEYSEEYVEKIAEKLNRKPRKKLGYQTAKELFAIQVEIRKL